MRKVFGFGINDSETPVQTKGWVGGVYKVNWRCPFYTKWANMLKRCYGKSSQYRTYTDCTVSDEWLTFSNFRDWMSKQEWEGKHLDKDLILQGNKQYGKESCVFISQELNTFLQHGVKSKNNDLPTGVNRGKSKSETYTSRIGVGKSGIYKHLGTFLTIEDARKAYVNKRNSIIRGFIENESNPLIQGALRGILCD